MGFVLQDFKQYFIHTYIYMHILYIYICIVYSFLLSAHFPCGNNIIFLTCKSPDCTSMDGEWNEGVLSAKLFDPTHNLHPQQSCKPHPLYTGAHWLHVAGHRICFRHSFFFFLHFTQPRVWLWTLEINFGNRRNRIHTFSSVRRGNVGMKKLLNCVGNFFTQLLTRNTQ